MKKTLVALFACLSVYAFAATEKHSWYDMEVDQIGGESWPTNGSNYGGYKCIVSNTLGSVYVDGDKTISYDIKTAMLITPEKAVTIDEDNYVSNSLAIWLDPIGKSDLPTLSDGARISVVAVGSSDGTNLWVSIGGGALDWTDTKISADMSSSNVVNVVICEAGDGGLVSRWNINGSPFECSIETVAAIKGLSFYGKGKIYACYGDVVSTGEQVSFWLINGYDDSSPRNEVALPVEIAVSITNSAGKVISITDTGDYKCRLGKQVHITYSLTNGWKFCDTGSSQRCEAFTVTKGAHVVLDGSERVPYCLGILDTDYGAPGGWLLIGQYEEYVYPYVGVIGRVTNVVDAITNLNCNIKMTPCYPASSHSYDLKSYGKTLTVDGCEYGAPERRYYYQQKDGSVGVAIDDCEFGITSFGENPTNSSEMVIGTIEDTYEGFGYYIEYASDLDFSDGYGCSDEFAIGGGKLTIGAPKGEDGKRFYRIGIFER